MRQPEKETLIKAIGAFVSERISVSLASATERIKALEQRAPERGEKGERGYIGPAGADGRQGDAGPEGARGQKGDTGERGPAGERGPEGPEGKPGRDGRDGLPGVQGEKGLDGKDGANGKDGRDGIDGKDGLGFDDITVEFDGERRFSLTFTKEGHVKQFGAFVVPCQIYRGVFKEGQSYERGDVVTWGGSSWHANEVTAEKPGISKAWTLQVKQGRDGKDGAPGAKGDQGPPGRPGIDRHT